MLTQGVGYPLYVPTSSRNLPLAYRKHGIRIGDVGAITSNGTFDFLFNVCKYNDPPGGLVNPAKLPDGFELLIPDIHSCETFDPCVSLTSTYVNEICDHASGL